MQALSRNRVLLAMRPSYWDLTNKLLYDLCRRHPEHTKADVISAKVMLIGRSYSAAIERGSPTHGESANFYIKTVAPMIQHSEIDQWIVEAKAVRANSSSALPTIVKIHGRVTNLFCEISGKEKRSLASKYLHFHVPRLFYIYDSRAARAVRELSPTQRRASRSRGPGDNEYQTFAEKCDHLRKHCAANFGQHLSPRQLDNLLLSVNER